MKKKLFGAIFTATFLMMGIAPLAANAAPPQTDVTGVITANGNPVSGAKVTAIRVLV